METLESLTAKLRTTKDIQSIVRTMKSLSSASIHHYEHAVEAISGYEHTISLGMQVLLRDWPAQDGRPILPVRETGKGRRPALVVFGSDRGLCGRFNDRISAFAGSTLRQNKTESRVLLCVLGLRVASRLESEGHVIDKLFELPGSIDGMAAAVQSVAIELETWTRERGASGVELLFNRRSGRSLAVPTRRIVLPIPHAELHRLSTSPWPSRRLPLYRMDRQRLLSWLLGEYLFVALYRALAESLASEHASRLAAMRSAERNIEERRDDLLSEFRKKRQESITRELLDLIAGYESVTADESSV